MVTATRIRKIMDKNLEEEISKLEYKIIKKAKTGNRGIYIGRYDISDDAIKCLEDNGFEVKLDIFEREYNIKW